MALVEIAFKGNRKEFFLWEGDEPLPGNVAVVVESDRGEDLGVVHSVGAVAEQRASGVPHRPGEEGVSLKVRRIASIEELRRNEELRSQDEDARRKAIERVKAAGLQAMKISDAEWRWDRRKLTLYFTSERRVDFRSLVRELASLFRTRIELKQIGVRDEAKRLGGIGRCGREYCSASWLPELRPVNLGVARDQRLSLNPTQISGACGRLMCCLRYEHDFYLQQRKRFPKEGKIIETATGEEKVVANDIFRERVTLRNAEGEVRTVPLADLRREWKNPTSGSDPAADEETRGSEDETVPDEVLQLQDTAEMPTSLRSAPRARERRLPVVTQRDRQTPAATQGKSRHEPRPPARVKDEATGRPQDSRPGPPTDDAKPVSGEDQASRRGRRRRGRRGGGKRGGGRGPDQGAPPGGTPPPASPDPTP